jgi:hypothetical protein
MYKKLTGLLLLIALLSACSKNQPQKPACGSQVCTAIFATVGIHFTDKQGNAIAVEDYTVFNLSSNKLLTPGVPNMDMAKGYYIVASDSNKKDYSSDGDNIRVTATDPATKQTKTVVLKISGGCNCHVDKISGPDTVAFD